MSGIEPGWYKDPADPTTQRYWDGEGWTGDPLPLDAVPPSGPPAPKPPPPPTPPPEISPPPQQVPPPAWAYPVPYPMPMPVPAPRPHGMRLAAAGARLAARVIDIFAVLVLNVVVNGWFVYEYVREISPVVSELWHRSLEGNRSTDGLRVTERASYLQIVIILLAAALWFAYEVPAVANTGQTLGKRLLGIRVVRLDTAELPASSLPTPDPQKLGFGRSFRRWNTMGLPTLLWSCCGIGFVLQFVDALFVAIDRPLHQALHDKSALTVVVQVGQSPARSETEAADDQAHSPRS